MEGQYQQMLALPEASEGDVPTHFCSCGRYFKTQQLLSTHLREEYQISLPGGERHVGVTVNVSQTHFCSCGRYFRFIDLLHIHLREHRTVLGGGFPVGEERHVRLVVDSPTPARHNATSNKPQAASSSMGGARPPPPLYGEGQWVTSEGRKNSCELFCFLCCNTHGPSIGSGRSNN